MYEHTFCIIRDLLNIQLIANFMFKMKNFKCIGLLVVALYLFNDCFAQNSDSTKTIIVQILHGSKPKRHTDGYKVLGGYFGGHAVIQIDSFVYGFNFWGSRVHPIPYPKHRHGVYQKQTLAEWNNEVEDDEVTSIYIPLSKKNYDELKDSYENYHLKCPHDYAFFGMRCAASAYWMLGNAGVLKKCSRRKSILHSFHPKMLRKKLVRLSKKRNYKMTEKKGKSDRIWEGV